MRPEVSNLRATSFDTAAGDVIIDRTTSWGNPYKIGTDGTRSEVIEKYKKYIVRHPQLLEDLAKLRPRRLLCWCKPRACHGDVLATLLDEYFEWEPEA